MWFLNARAAERVRERDSVRKWGEENETAGAAIRSVSRFHKQVAIYTTETASSANLFCLSALRRCS